MASEFTSSVESTRASVNLSKGTVLKNAWEVTRRLGEGGCGVVYEVIDRQRNRRAALKAKPITKNKDDEILKMEVHVLKKLQGKDHVCVLYTCGKTSSFNFMVMSLLGENLGDMRRACPKMRCTTSTSVRLAIQCFKGISYVHDIGFVHRDVKPANFALGGDEKTQRQVFMLDFGLARQIEEIKDGKRKMRDPRPSVPFRGTLRYCSLNTHRRMEQGRHDDLWSLIYMTIEFIRGELPWRNKNKEETRELKESTTDRKLLEHCPSELNPILGHLKTLTYYKKPNYKLCLTQLEQVLIRKKCSGDEPYDWEDGGRYADFFGNKYSAPQGSPDAPTPQGSDSPQACHPKPSRQESEGHVTLSLRGRRFVVT